MISKVKATTDQPMLYSVSGDSSKSWNQNKCITIAWIQTALKVSNRLVLLDE
eukprot:CAMPEP_0170566364 /NCGR_PEP_ID=MMETSP0211-20121228/79789_1 /TAXON_ID=311385 /ORGANISM="Pseudokeronopsis sp., Strain OXSARD2" /LENGTH=51 /DNA_ID=CAMNT_0010887513 /DNA_START=484 /DNA_END=639 /DNA_ORIENTATION=+